MIFTYTNTGEHLGIQSLTPQHRTFVLAAGACPCARPSRRGVHRSFNRRDTEEDTFSESSHLRLGTRDHPRDRSSLPAPRGTAPPGTFSAWHPSAGLQCSPPRALRGALPHASSDTGRPGGGRLLRGARPLGCHGTGSPPPPGPPLCRHGTAPRRAATAGHRGRPLREEGFPAVCLPSRSRWLAERRREIFGASAPICKASSLFSFRNQVAEIVGEMPPPPLQVSPLC